MNTFSPGRTTQNGPPVCIGRGPPVFTLRSCEICSFFVFGSTNRHNRAVYYKQPKRRGQPLQTEPPLYCRNGRPSAMPPLGGLSYISCLHFSLLFFLPLTEKGPVIRHRACLCPCGYRVYACSPRHAVPLPVFALHGVFPFLPPGMEKAGRSQPGKARFTVGYPTSTVTQISMPFSPAAP